MQEKYLKIISLRNDDIPSLETCQEFIHNENNLENRTSLQVRTWIISEKKRIKQSKHNHYYIAYCLITI